MHLFTVYLCSWQVYFSDSRMQLPPLSPELQARRAAARDACLAAGVPWEEEDDEVAGGCRGVEVAYFSGGRRNGPSSRKRSRGELASTKGALGVMNGFSAAVADTVESCGEANDGSGNLGDVCSIVEDEVSVEGASEFYWGGKRAVREAREAAAKQLRWR